jgi:hypothetical protein
MVNEINVDFAVNAQESIRFKLPHAPEDLRRCDEITVLFQEKCGKAYILYAEDCAAEALITFRGQLERALKGSLELDSSIMPGPHCKDPGYLWSVYLHKIASEETIIDKDLESLINKGLHEACRLVFLKKPNGEKDWIGELYLMWDSAHGRPKTWLYTRNGTIILEITPAYKWHFIEPEEGEQSITFEEFLKNYKPCAIREISKETAQEWLSKIDELLTIIEANDRTIFEDH